MKQLEEKHREDEEIVAVGLRHRRSAGLTRCACETLKEVFQEAVPEENDVPGAVIAIHSRGVKGDLRVQGREKGESLWRLGTPNSEDTGEFGGHHT